ncbi:hypothetical protein FBU30_009950 [Linnemannia zychae]|nr:hypothetical protein FBU30_009950 [Linnemannia zychae]
MDHSMASGFKPGLGSAVWSPDLTPMSEPQYIGALIGLFLLSIGFRALVAAQGYLEAYLHLHFYPRTHSSFSHSRHRQNEFIQPYSHQRRQKNSLLEEENEIGDEEGFQSHGQQQQNLAFDNTSDIKAHFEEAAIGPFSANIEKNSPSLQPRQGVLSQQSYNVSPSKPKRYGGRRHHSPPPFYASSSSQASSSLSFMTFPTVQPFVWQAEVARALLTTAVVGIGYMLMLVIMTYNSAYLGVILAGVFVGEVYFARWGRVRPIFPSSNSNGQSSKMAETKQQETLAQSSAVSAAATGAATAGVVARTAAMSTTSLASTASSRGYSAAMAHHGLSSDGAC